MKEFAAAVGLGVAIGATSASVCSLAREWSEGKASGSSQPLSNDPCPTGAVLVEGIDGRSVCFDALKGQSSPLTIGGQKEINFRK